MGKTIGEMTDELRAINIAKGHRPAEGGPGENTLGDYLALLASEVAEALEAYRSWRLTDATGFSAVGMACEHCEREILAGDTYVTVPGTGGLVQCGDHAAHLGEPLVATLPKPEGVGSELADILCRLLDTADVFGFQTARPSLELCMIPELPAASIFPLTTFGDRMTWLNYYISQMWVGPRVDGSRVLRALVTVARTYGIDLDFEYRRKVAHNRTRAFRHGGRALSEAHS